MNTALKFVLLLSCAFTFAQTTVTGKVTDDKGLPLPGANVIVVGTTTGAISDYDGNYSITTNQNPPFSLQVSSIGFESVTKEITSSNLVMDFSLVEGTELDEVVISASRTPERIFESPVTVERFGLKEIRNTASAEFYDGLENLKGVDINTNSLTFKAINTRGFATFANTRFMQLVDGMDNAAPALNFPLGNLLGMTETDILSVELLPGAASALYGANAFNGILFMQSKNPFDYPGISGYIKQGVTSQDAGGTNHYSDLGLRIAHKFSNKFAAKVNFGYLKGTDWVADNRADKLNRGLTRDNLDYDGINVYGDEVSTNIRAASGGLGVVPNVVVSRTGYAEENLTDYNARSIKADWGIYFRPWEDDFEVSYVGKYGTGNTIYQGTNRYYINNFTQNQHKIELKNDNFFVRGYITEDNAGDSYDMVFTGININRLWKSDQQWFQEYIQTYVGATLGGANDDQAHAAARAQAETGRYEPGSPEFKAAFDQVTKDPNFATGSKFQDNSKVRHTDANYNFSHLVDFADIQVGGSYREYELNSSGTIYTDVDGPIFYSEVGVYTQIQKEMELSDMVDLKLTGSLRYDKSELFDGFFSPRISAGFTVNDNHNIRASYQTGFRNPTTQDLYIGLDAGRAILVGSSPENLDRYSRDYPVSASGQQMGQPSTVTQTGRAAYENSYSATSVRNFAATGNPGVLEIANSDLVKPEQVSSYEIGYRGKYYRTTLDMSVYYNKYQDFISGEAVIAPFYGTAGDGSQSVAAIANGDFKTYQTYTNSVADVNSYGGSIEISTKVFANYDLSGNYTYTKQDFDQDSFPDFITSFNTPEHKVKASFGNTELFTNFGFLVSWRWSDTYFWQATFGNGQIPSYNVVDAQVNYTFPKLKSVIKVGATNLLGDDYYTAFGTGFIGSMYYVGLTINNL
ncbi:TonB-dependent Receptor Plug Domain [Flavobacteriaceae bacterium MAR_2010_188]|nr:TonB-dependent Receptor Plug Domain [Flavobacteriaceae bacterium MAR_2010_188]